MEIYLAPMEGVTGHIVRNAFAHNFGGVDKYFTPFDPTAMRMSKKIKRDLDPANNKDVHLVPQIIPNTAEEVPMMLEQMKGLGYTEVNINLGCPSGTVTSKKRGSGMLLYPDELDRMLDGIYSAADIPLSVKTRIGFHSPEEWPVILDVYKKYPMCEFIIHPRVRDEMYSGFPHLDAYALAEEAFADSPVPLCYNGDIWKLSDYHERAAMFPRTDRFMIGRGLLARPDLAAQIKGLPVPDLRAQLRAFCDEIYDGYRTIFSSEKDAVWHMKEIWANLSKSFEDSGSLVKKLLKAQTPVEYNIYLNKIFDTLDLAER